MFNSAEQALLFSAVPVGTLLGTLPITPLTSRFGMRRTFTAYGLISGLATLLTPLSVHLDFGLLLIMRVLQVIKIN
jgi:MFS family permease